MFFFFYMSGSEIRKMMTIWFLMDPYDGFRYNKFICLPILTQHFNFFNNMIFYLDTNRSLHIMIIIKYNVN